jgi:DnaJ-class molecular chaperone
MLIFGWGEARDNYPAGTCGKCYGFRTVTRTVTEESVFGKFSETTSSSRVTCDRCSGTGKLRTVPGAAQRI